MAAECWTNGEMNGTFNGHDCATYYLGTFLPHLFLPLLSLGACMMAALTMPFWLPRVLAKMGMIRR